MRAIGQLLRVAEREDRVQAAPVYFGSKLPNADESRRAAAVVQLVLQAVVGGVSLKVQTGV